MTLRGEIRYEWACEFKKCFNIKNEVTRFYYGETIPAPCLPEGWIDVELDGIKFRFCHEHKKQVQKVFDIIYALAVK